MTGRRIYVYCTLIVMGLGATVALAIDADGQHTGTPCFGVAADDIVWCDNFDTYCSGGAAWDGYPPFPAVCADGTSTPDNAAFKANWPRVFNCGMLWPDTFTTVVEENGAWSNDRDYNTPFAMKNEGCRFNEANCANLSSSRHVFSMASAIDDQWPGATEVNGTDSEPLRMKFHLDHETKDDGQFHGGSLATTSFYVELCKDGDRAPTDYTWVPCATTTSRTFPILCQSWRAAATPPAGYTSQCPPQSTTIHSSIAVGMMAMMDPDPCTNNFGTVPTCEHLAVFDGLTWWDLRPGSIGIPGTDNFYLYEGGDAWVEIWIRTDSVYIKYTFEWCCATHPSCEDGYCTKTQDVSVVIIPRQYTGGFNEIAYGLGEGCELSGATYECYGPTECFSFDAPNKKGLFWWHTWLDSLVVYDGVVVIPPCDPPVVASAESVKTHGTEGDFAIDVLNLTGDQDVEPREGGVTKLVVGFDIDIQGVGGLDASDVSLTSGVVDAVTPSASNELTIEMSGTTDGVPLTVTFPGIAAGCDVAKVCTDSVCVRQLVGDARATASLAVNAEDRIEVRDAVGAAANSGNFRADVRADGSVNAADRIVVRDAVGNGFGGTCP